jgi:tRNA guanosine-2'-O-methyltransferase
LRDRKREGYTVVGIEQTDRSGILGEDDDKDGEVTGKEKMQGKGEGGLPRKCVLVLGAERSGITAEVLAVVDRCVEIRTVGVTRSLNVQTAGGIAVYEWWREWGGGRA